MGLSGLIRLGSKLGKATSGGSGKTITKAQKKAMEKLRKQGVKLPEPRKDIRDKYPGLNSHPMPSDFKRRNITLD